MALAGERVLPTQDEFVVGEVPEAVEKAIRRGLPAAARRDHRPVEQAGEQPAKFGGVKWRPPGMATRVS